MRPFCALLALFCLSGCATTSCNLERDSGFTKKLIRGRDFVLFSRIKVNSLGEPLTVYIEGDGRAWITRYSASSDPTPSDPLVMRLASLDPSPNVAYLARPGQYPSQGASDCDAKYWMSKRFAPEVIADMDSAVSCLRDMAGAGSVSLVGYSGGGAVAALIAARRGDVAGLRTIAGNLDSDAVSSWNKVSPLKGSLNPAGIAGRLKGLPQRHFVAYNDRIIPVSAAESFADNAGDEKHASITVVTGVTHYSGWETKWPGLLDMPLSK
jgi:hypothetical protein